MITSTFAATMRRPSSRKPSLMRFFCSGGTFSHSRTMSGPWLAAKAPTRLAIQPPHEFVVLHAHGEEVVAQEVGVGALGEEGRVVLGDRTLHALVQRVPGNDFLRIGAEIGCERRLLQVEEKLREPVVAHAADYHAKNHGDDSGHRSWRTTGPYGARTRRRERGTRLLFRPKARRAAVAHRPHVPRDRALPFPAAGEEAEGANDRQGVGLPAARRADAAHLKVRRQPPSRYQRLV